LKEPINSIEFLILIIQAKMLSVLPVSSLWFCLYFVCVTSNPMSDLVKQKDYDWKDSNVALLGTDKDRAVKRFKMASLVKGKDYDWKDSNVALFGTSKDRQVKKESALTEPAWEPVGKATSPFLMVWRVNQFKIEPVPEDEIGNFYNGDSYIVCKATQAPGGNKLLYNIHFWIGKHSTSDEYGTAAYKTVELDTYLDDAAIQHREVDGFESDLFNTLKGGYASGFRQVKPEEYKPRLLHFCKEGKITYMRQVKYSKQSVHSGDVFILDLGDRAYQFNGATSSPFERSAAAAFLQDLECKRNGRCVTHVLEDETTPKDHEFWTSLPDVPVPEKEPPKEVVKSLYKVSDATGKMELTVISEGSAPRKEIKSDDVYMILAKQGLFVYIGKDCSVNEKRNALSHAHKFMQTSPNPYLPITVVTDEQAKSFLKDIWDEIDFGHHLTPNLELDLGTEDANNLFEISITHKEMAGLVKGKDYDWKDSNVALFGSDTDRQVKKESAETEKAWKPVRDTCSPFLMAWRIKQFKLEPVPDNELGTFYDGDSYIVCKATKSPNCDKLSYDIHFWIGKHSTADEYGTAAYKTVELDTFLDDAATQHREVDGHESPKFISYFKKFMTLHGGYDSGFRQVKPEEYKPRLLHFCRQNKVTYLREVFFSKQSVKSEDVYILDLGTKAIQFNGSASSGFEKNAAGAYLQYLESQRNGRCKTSVMDEENGRDHDFWSNLPDDPLPEKEPRKEIVKALYRVSDETGKMEVTLVAEGKAPKNDITSNDVYMILAKEGLFVYIGKDCSVTEKRNAMSNAHAFMQTCPDPYLPITVVCEENAESLLKGIWD
uniref:HP domain-containing protein n=1 Tax=Rodentolepis nana TaxID=102285 RepID=A0A0R3TMT5_RODNA